MRDLSSAPHGRLILRPYGRAVISRAAALALLAALLSALTVTPSPGAAAQAPVPVVVRAAAPPSGDAERLVRALGGTVTRALPLVDGFAALVPPSSVTALERSSAVAAVWVDARVRMHDDDDDDDDFDEDDIRTYDPLPPNEAWREAIGLSRLEPGLDGDGVTVAVLDTGVVETPDLRGSVRARVDFTPDGDGADRYGHGTHMAGIVAGDGLASLGRWRGVAPEADLVSVKVASWDGATDVSTVLAALQWVVSNKDRFGIRVLNLSFGTDSRQSYLQDPLDYAVERVWAAGILVVAAAGNRGSGEGTISKPGDDPYVLTVGAANLQNTVERTDDVVAGFSSRGPTQDGLAKPDLVAPGVTVVSARAAGSTIDAFRPAARVDEHYFKGTGSSQAAAVVSGIAALMFEADPTLTPDVAKATLVGTTTPELAGQPGAGSGLVNAAATIEAVAAGAFRDLPANRGLTRSSGTGSLHESRGSHRVWTDWGRDGTLDVVDNEREVLGSDWDGPAWAAAEWNLATWILSPWAPLVGEAAGFDPMPPTPGTWPGMRMEQDAWNAKYWSESVWDAKYWSGKYWSSSSWN